MNDTNDITSVIVLKFHVTKDDHVVDSGYLKFSTLAEFEQKVEGLHKQYPGHYIGVRL